jgi:transcriptional regulator with XRE-family HTH domain
VAIALLQPHVTERIAHVKSTVKKEIAASSPAAKASFDSDGFYAALDAQRVGLALNWKQVAAASGVSASTFSRLAQGKRPDVDSLAALAAWSGISVSDFVRTGGKKAARPEPLALITSYLRSDPNLTKEAASALEEMFKATYSRLRR